MNLFTSTFLCGVFAASILVTLGLWIQTKSVNVLSKWLFRASILAFMCFLVPFISFEFLRLNAGGRPLRFNRDTKRYYVKEKNNVQETTPLMYSSLMLLDGTIEKTPFLLTFGMGCLVLGGVLLKGKKRKIDNVD